MKEIADLLGRIFLSLIFFFEVLDMALFYGQTKETMTGYGITYAQDTLLIVTMIAVGLGALLVAIGYFARLGAFLLLIYWLSITFIVYDFWNAAPEFQKVNMVDFMRNLAVAGGLLLLMAHGSGEYSIRRLIHVMKLPQ